jgi:hypothetical protein
MAVIARARPIGWNYAAVWRALAATMLLTYLVAWPIPSGSDAANYYALDLADPYRNRWAAFESFVYSPAYAQALYPLTLLPFEAFYKVLQAVNLACLWWLLGPWSAVALLLPFVQGELVTGQIHLPLAVMCVLGVRNPGVLAYGLLTKVTPGVGLLWFAARRQWRDLAVAVGVTVAVVTASAVIAPGLWVGWLNLLAESSTRNVENFTINEWPAVYRLSFAAGLVVLAAWRDRPAALPVIVCFALPGIWFGALVLLLAVPRLAASVVTLERSNDSREMRRATAFVGRGRLTGAFPKHLSRR